MFLSKSRVYSALEKDMIFCTLIMRWSHESQKLPSNIIAAVRPPLPLVLVTHEYRSVHM